MGYASRTTREHTPPESNKSVCRVDFQGSIWIPGSYVSNSSRIEPSKAFPRRLTLWTNSKKPKYSGKYVL